MTEQLELQKKAVTLVFDKGNPCSIAATKLDVTPEKFVELIYDFYKYENVKKKFDNVDTFYQRFMSRFFDAIDDLYESKENNKKLTKEIQSIKLSLSIFGKDYYNQHIDSCSFIQTE